MRKLGFSLLLLLMGIGIAFAQGDDKAKVAKRMKEVQEYKMKYIAQELELSEVQKKKFFELYDEMCASKKQCYDEAMHLERKIKHDPQATEADYQKVTEALNKANTEWAETEKTYNEKFAEFLSQKQIYKMREAENNFRAKFEELKHNRKRDHHKKAIDTK